MSASGDRLRAMADRAGLAARACAGQMAAAGKDAIKDELTKRGHPKGTPTPSPPGQPPARVSGNLWDHVISTSPTSAGAHRWVAMAGPSDVAYSRIHEFGGITGRNHAAVIPPRPYVLPAVTALRASGRLTEISAHTFQAVVHGQ